MDVMIEDVAYKTPPRTHKLRGRSRVIVVRALSSSQGWYDLTVTAAGSVGYLKPYAGRVETGKVTTTDPVIGQAPS